MPTYIAQRDAAIAAIQALIYPNNIGAIDGQVHQDCDTGQTTDAYANLVAHDGFRYKLVRDTGNAVTNGTNLAAAYVDAAASSPTATDRVAVLLMPGVYSMGTGTLAMDTEFVDIAGLAAPESVVIVSSRFAGDGTGTITKSCDNAIISSVTIRNDAAFVGSYSSNDPSGFAPQGVYPNERIENVVFRSLPGANPAMRMEWEYAGTYVDCRCVDEWTSFSVFSIATGTFERCSCNFQGFGTSGLAPCSGTFTDCSTVIGLGSGSPVITGKFTKCIASQDSFGLASSANGGTYIDCVGGPSCFLGNLSGSFIGCTAGSASFGNNGNELSGTFKDCSAGPNSFGLTGSKLSGSFINCSAGDNSFGGQSSEITGSFTGCVAGNNSFGFGNSAAVVTYDGARLFNCKAGDYSFGWSAVVKAGTVFDSCIAGGASFGSGNNGAGGEISGRFEHCSAGNASFGSGVAAPRGATIGLGITASARFVDCSAGTFSFGSVPGMTCAGTFIRCSAGDHSFCTASGATPGQYIIDNGTYVDCTAGDYSFASASPALGATEADGQYVRCEAGQFSFGYGGTGTVASGSFQDCSGLQYSFAGNSGHKKSGLFVRCHVHGTSTDSYAVQDLGPLTAGGRMVDCQWIIGGASRSALLIDASTAGTEPIVYGGVFRSGDGATPVMDSFDGVTSVKAKVVGVKMNTALDATVFNEASVGATDTEGNYIYAAIWP